METAGKRVVSRVEDSRMRLIHGDVTEDHVLLVREDGAWSVAAVLDFGDAEVGPSPRPPDMRAPSSAEEALVFTFLHRFNWALIRTVIQREAVDPSAMTSLRFLADIMWPSEVFGGL